MKAKKVEPMVRVNSRFTKAQQAFIKATAKKMKIGEGELHRAIIDYYIKHNK